MEKSDTIPEELTCPVCFELPEQEVYQCLVGHILCAKCFAEITLRPLPEITLCPQCRQQLPKGLNAIRSRKIEELLDKLKINCPNQTNGCPSRVYKHLLKAHKLSCPYTGIGICKILGNTGCIFNMTRVGWKEVINHFTTSHGYNLCNGNACTFSIQLVKGPNKLYMPIILNMEAEKAAVLLLTIINGDGTLSWLPFHLNCPTPLQVGFLIENKKKSSVERWTQSSVDISHCESSISNFHHFRLPLVELVENFAVEGEVKVNVKVSKWEELGASANQFCLSKKDLQALKLNEGNQMVDRKSTGPAQFIARRVIEELEVKDNDGNTPLQIAVKEKNLRKITELVSAGADVNTRNNNGETPLLQATLAHDLTSSIDTFKVLIDAGANVKQRDGVGIFLHSLLSSSRISPKQVHDLSEYLCSKKHGGLYNMPAEYLSVTPLQFAVKNVELEERTLDLLGRNGVDFNAKDRDQNSVLFYAIWGQRKMVCLNALVRLKADFRHVGKYKQNLLFAALRYGNSQAVQLLLDLGLDANAVDQLGCTPLHFVAKSGTDNVLQFVKMLVKSGANVNKTDRDGKTPLDLATGRFNKIIGLEDLLRSFK